MAKKRARHAGGDEIADDVLREAFARLPSLQDLLRCAATCRRWRRLVTDRAFLRRIGLWPDTARRPCVLAGIFSQNTFPGGSGWVLSKTDRPPQFLSLQPAGTHLSFDSFGAFDHDDDALYGLARPLAARRGFLLVRVLLDGGRKLHLAVCRPLVNKRTTCLLPPPPFNTTHLMGCAILTGADYPDDDDDDDNSSLDHKQQQSAKAIFQVVLIYFSDKWFVCACTYSSDTGTWSAPVECSRCSELTMCGPQAGVVTRGGMVHWLFMDNSSRIYYALNISAATSHVSLTEIPIKVHARGEEGRLPVLDRMPIIPCIAGEQGRLSFVTIRDHGVAELWTKQEEEDGARDDGVWRCSELAELGSERIDLAFFAESRGALLVEQGGDFSIVDLKSKEKMSVHLKKKRRTRSLKTKKKKRRTGYERRSTRRFPESCSSTYCRGHPDTTCGHTHPRCSTR